MKRSALPLALAAAFACFGLFARAAVDPDNLTRAGTFTLFKFEQAIGEERYEIRPGTGGSEGPVLISKFSFVDRGTPVPLDVALQPVGIARRSTSSSTATPRAFRKSTRR